MQQYFVHGRAPQEGLVTITDKETAKHMFSVMRLQPDDEVVLVFDDAIKRRAKVISKEDQTFEIIEDLADMVELPVSVTVAVGFPKGDKLEFLAQKATELGASQLQAFPADWSVVKWDSKKLAKKAEKLEKIALGAAEQSKRNRIPAVQLFETKTAFLQQLTDFDHILIAYEEAAKQGETSQLVQALNKVHSGDTLLFVFGPEGGISPAEIDQLTALGAKTIGLGPRILRAETAPLYVLSVVSYAVELKGS
ncbi:16S rRNA (uracil(1498)-N(3))-methyltransferase [Streptococcus sp. E17BB]|uniref:16S rRNA (uracil(1498)-N(3))-methyltransferase n=1 Tax=Streptococcus sp. E17BB TaxID=3278714 RepID=UPI00359EC0E7